jgi:integrase
MATKQQQKRQQNGNIWTPPRGIRYSERPGLPRPFLLHWRGLDGTRKCVAYDTKPKREKAAKALVTKREQSGRSVMDFNPADWFLWTQFRELIGEADPLDVARFWLSKGGPDGAKPNIRLSELINRYLAARGTEGVGRASLSHTKGDLTRFAAAFGERGANELTADMLRAWLRALPYAPTTKRNHHKHGAALFNWSIREGVFDGQNPFRNVEKPPLTTDEVETLTPEQTAALFATAQAQRPAACARLALEFFAGLRHSTAAKLSRSEIDFTARGIRIPAAKIKTGNDNKTTTGRAEYIEKLPGNLWVWLATAPDDAWTLQGKDYERAKSDVFRLAGIENPGNVARHSFCTYHVALNRDAAATAVILCHTSPRMLYRHYKGIATEEAGARYFAIVPAWFPSSP